MYPQPWRGTSSGGGRRVANGDQAPSPLHPTLVTCLHVSPYLHAMAICLSLIHSSHLVHSTNPRGSQIAQKSRRAKTCRSSYRLQWQSRTSWATQKPRADRGLGCRWRVIALRRHHADVQGLRLLSLSQLTHFVGGFHWVSSSIALHPQWEVCRTARTYLERLVCTLTLPADTCAGINEGKGFT